MLVYPALTLVAILFASISSATACATPSTRRTADMAEPVLSVRNLNPLPHRRRHPACGEGDRPRRGAGGDRRHRRRVRLGQEPDHDVGDGTLGLERLGGRFRQVPRPGARGSLGRQAQPLSRLEAHDDLPGADDLARPALSGRRPARAPADDPRRPEQGGGPQAVHRVARARADPRSGAAPRLLSARAGRPAPARHDRHGARQQSGRAHRRRTDDGPRRDGPGPILELLADLQKRLEMSIVFITHDLGIAPLRRPNLRDEERRGGRAERRATAAPNIPTPARRRARGCKEPVAAGAPVVLDARNVKVTFHLKGGFLGRARISCAPSTTCESFRPRGETVGIVGESGSGKSTLGRAIRLQPASGLIRFEDEPHAARPERHAPLRRQLQVVFQDPFGSPRRA